MIDMDNECRGLFLGSRSFNVVCHENKFHLLFLLTQQSTRIYKVHCLKLLPAQNSICFDQTSLILNQNVVKGDNFYEACVLNKKAKYYPPIKQEVFLSLTILNTKFICPTCSKYHKYHVIIL
jgi:hypothetical protein